MTCSRFATRKTAKLVVVSGISLFATMLALSGTLKAQSSICDTKSPPSFGAIAKAITTTSGGQTSFVTDYDALSQGAWCTFIALNWAAAGTSPTMTADKTKSIGTCTQQSQNCPVVWETWTDSNSLFQANGTPPQGCSAGGLRAVRTPLVHRLESVVPNQMKNHRLALAAGNDQGIDEFKQATGFQLPDKNNSATNPSVFLYEVRENPSFVGTICTNKLYNLDGQLAFFNKANPPAGGLPPGPSGLQFDGTAFEVKPAWYAVPSTSSEPDQLGMFTAQGACATSVTCGQTGTLTIGLGGLHILWKVFTNSTWYWMTFEYVNPSGTDNMTLAPVLKTQLAEAYLPNGKTKKAFGPFAPSTPTPSTIATAAQNANKIFQPMLTGTRLANYQLVAVQAVPVLNGQNTLVANNVIETDFGSPNYNNSPLNPSSSCISCHYAASIGPVTTSPCSLGRINFFAPPAFVSGLQGAFDPSIYAGSSGGQGYINSDFVWTMRKAQWMNTGSGCPPSASSSKSATKGAGKAK